MDKNIFISYCWSNDTEVDEIDDYFKSKGIELKRDKREIKYTKSIKEFMKTIRNTDYVLMIISDEYLKSFNCMYEVLEFIKDDDYKDRILPVIIDNAKIYGVTSGVEYIKYWNEELFKLDDETKGLSQEDITPIIENKKRLKKIQASIMEFISEVSDMKHYSFKEVKEANYSQIFDYIGINEKTYQPKIVINDENLMIESYSEKYQTEKTSGIVTFDYSNNNGIYTVGQNELLFDLKWSKASNTSIHFLSDPNSIKEVALVKDVSDITEIANAQEYDVSSRARTARLNQIAIFRNVNGYYCAVKVISIKDDSRGDDRDELTFEYVIQTNGSPNFIDNISKEEIRAYEKRIDGHTSIYKNPYSENIQKLDNLFLKVKQTVDNYFNGFIYYLELIDKIKEWREEIVIINSCHHQTGVSDFEKHQKIDNLIRKVTLIYDLLENSNFFKNKELINGQINNFLFERGQL